MLHLLPQPLNVHRLLSTTVVAECLRLSDHLSVSCSVPRVILCRILVTEHCSASVNRSLHVLFLRRLFQGCVFTRPGFRGTSSQASPSTRASLPLARFRACHICHPAFSRATHAVDGVRSTEQSSISELMSSIEQSSSA